MTRSPRWFVLLALVALAGPGFAGCLDSVKDRLPGAFSGGERRPAYQYSETAAFEPQVAREFPFKVDAMTARYIVDVELSASTPIVPAEVTVSVLNPSGERVGDAVTLGPQSTTARFEVSNPTPSGAWALKLEGRGLAGGGQGASYTVTLTEVLKRV